MSMPEGWQQGGSGEPLDNHPGHEIDDVNAGGILKTAGVLGAFLVVVYLVLRIAMGDFSSIDSRIRSADSNRDQAAPASPRLQVDPATELAGLREEERKGMNSYQWVDRKAGIARIPVDRAMEIVARSGLPKPSAPKETGVKP
jgi:hypothetical protein